MSHPPEWLGDALWFLCSMGVASAVFGAGAFLSYASARRRSLRAREETLCNNS